MPLFKVDSRIVYNRPLFGDYYNFALHKIYQFWPCGVTLPVIMLMCLKVTLINVTLALALAASQAISI